MSKKNMGLLLVVLLVVAVIAFSAMYTAVTYAGGLPWGFESQFAAYCAGSAGGACSVGV
ncbi:MAG: hypothetical protein M5U34_09190 [Chloroflexi bacterium]|nr:hypothetical protein [Chloroflexota bacterium]